MPNYRKASRAVRFHGQFDDDAWEMMNAEHTIVVHETDAGDEFIGIYDADGDPLVRATERVAIGYHLSE